MIIETKDVKITLTTDEFQTIEEEEMLATFVQMVGSIGLNIETVDMLHELEQICDSVEFTGDIDPGFFDYPSGVHNISYGEPEEVRISQPPSNEPLNMLEFLHEVLVKNSVPGVVTEEEVE